MRAVLEGVSEHERQEWLNHPCSEALAIFFELVRMTALEGLEAGARREDAALLAGQASLGRDIRRFIAETLKEGITDDESVD